MEYEVAKRDGYLPECIKCVRTDALTLDTSSRKHGLTHTGIAGVSASSPCSDKTITPIPNASFARLYDVLTTSEVDVSQIPGKANPANVKGAVGKHYTQPKFGAGVEYIGTIRLSGPCNHTPEHVALLLSRIYGDVFTPVKNAALAGNDVSETVQTSVLTEALQPYSAEDKILLTQLAKQAARNAARDAFKTVFAASFTAGLIAARDIGTRLFNAKQATPTQVFTAMVEQALLTDINHVTNAALKQALIYSADDAYFELTKRFNVTSSDTTGETGSDLTNRLTQATITEVSVDQGLRPEVLIAPQSLFGEDWRFVTEKFNFEVNPPVLEFSAYPDTPMSSGTSMSAGAWLLTAQVQFNAAILNDTINYRYRI